MQNILQHFRKDEQPFIERVIEWKKEVEDRYAPKLTVFLDPREQHIVQSIIGTHDEINVYSEGAFQEAERKRLYIAPSYFEPTIKDFEIIILKLTFPSKFVELRHPDVLGALLSLGIDRKHFGDIRIDKEIIQFACTKEIALYVKTNLTKIGRINVRIDELENMEELILPQDEWIEKVLTVSSMRLDAILSNSFNISRQKSQNLIRGGKVKVNFALCEETSYELQEGDTISCRGFGRFKITRIEGRTKKDKIRLTIGLFERK
ncbi:YlmH family RNA-binding protein [Ureibacillus sp. FSL W8-0352]|uniref:YlmH family RNA-binding protein n=1 Tax=Ureibacillus sp. FSL W8-0352 TaxID=2954596 RepID=UPI0030F6B294